MSAQQVTQIANMLDLFAVIVILLFAFAFQFLLKELPCPLCLLQRAGFIMTGIGFLMNLRFGLRPSHYVLALLGALFTAFVALRQIALHVVPGTGSYGSSILGLHMYTWSFIASMAIVLFTAVILGIDRQYHEAPKASGYFKTFTHILFAIILVLTVSNFISVLAECGLSLCPDNPDRYLW